MLEQSNDAVSTQPELVPVAPFMSATQEEHQELHQTSLCFLRGMLQMVHTGHHAKMIQAHITALEAITIKKPCKVPIEQLRYGTTPQASKFASHQPARFENADGPLDPVPCYGFGIDRD